ncbi:MAG: hypothetical protein KatS3mg101_1153 [Patescibacteria group bacterium]|nr:MAG: hypothetical protein KatS3mg101_1153 [Patescibacteria group bacterium]
MSRKTILIIASIVVLAVAAYAYHIYKKKQLEKEAQEVEETEPAPESNFTGTYPLRKGSRGKEVAKLQAFLLKKFGWQGAVDGIFDERLEQAVQKYFGEPVFHEALYKLYNIEQIKTHLDYA